MNNYLTVITNIESNILPRSRDELKKILNIQKQVVEHSREKGLPFAYVTYKSQQSGRPLSEVYVEGGETFSKINTSIFSSDDFTKYIKENNIKGLIISGYDILPSVCDAIDNGLEVIIPKGSIVSDGSANCRAEASFFRTEGLLKDLNELP